MCNRIRQFRADSHPLTVVRDTNWSESIPSGPWGRRYWRFPLAMRGGFGRISAMTGVVLYNVARANPCGIAHE